MKISAQNITTGTIIQRHGMVQTVESTEDKRDGGNLRIRIKAGGFYFMSDPTTMVEVEDRVIDLGGPDGGRYWRVVTDHAIDHPDAHAAAVHARVTGSVGCTYNDAKVERPIKTEA